MINDIEASNNNVKFVADRYEANSYKWQALRRTFGLKRLGNRVALLFREAATVLQIYICCLYTKVSTEIAAEQEKRKPHT